MPVRLSLQETQKYYFKKSQKRKQLSQGLTAKIYDSNGKFLEQYTVKSKSSNSLQSGNVSSNNGDKFIVGTYKKELNKDNKSKYKILGWKDGSNGVYFTRFDSRGKQKGIEFYDFTAFTGFKDFVSNRTEKKIRKKRNRGKKSLIGYNLVVHDPVFRGDEVIIVSEAYYKEYRTETRCCDQNGNTYTVQVFVGYRTTHGLVASFNLDGDLLWSSTFAVNTLSYTLKERINVIPSGDQTQLAFSWGGSIYKKTIEGDQVIDVSEKEIETNFGGDKVKTSYESDMDYWYDDYYIAYGYQKIKTDKKKRKATRSSKKKRTVFYFNKIQVD